MQAQKVHFKNHEGFELAAHLLFPSNQHPYAFAIFAHCFTCNKHFSAVKNISEALANRGIAVLRFDFTGLGESEGDFANTNFSSNVEDLVAAAQFLAENYSAPELIVGHSLGGAAVIFAAQKIPSIKAICTIGAPSSPKHISHLLKDDLKKINENGKATIQLAGRPFTIKKQFLDDLESKNLPQTLADNRKAILVMHSPQDETVGIENARELYENAFHPKSFVSLDGASHLLLNKEDSLYAGNVLAAWVDRYIPKPELEHLKTTHQVLAYLDHQGFTTDVKAGRHQLIADEPLDVGGDDFGPSPYDLVASGLATCTAMTLKMYAQRKDWQLTSVKVHVDHGKNHCQDCERIEDQNAIIDHFDRFIELEGSLDNKQKQRLLQIANKCPVHKTMNGIIEVHTSLV